MKKEDKNTYVTKTLKVNESLDELDFVLYDEFGFKYDDDSQFMEIEMGKEPYTSATPVKIDSLIKKLQSLKKKGATHIEIEHNGDHHGYDISAFEIRESTEVEIEKFNEKRIKYEAAEKKISSLYIEIEQIKRTMGSNDVD